MISYANPAVFKSLDKTLETYAQTMDLGKKLLDEGKIDEAHATVTSAVSSFPMLAEGFYLSADIYERRPKKNAEEKTEDFKKAVVNYTSALKLSPGRIDAIKKRTRLYLALGDSGLARQDIETIKTIEKRKTEYVKYYYTSLKKGYARTEHSKIKELINTTNANSADSQTNSAIEHAFLAYESFHANSNEEVIYQCVKTLKLREWDFNTAIILASALAFNKRTEEAMSYLDDIMPSFTDSRANFIRGRLYIYQNELGLAKQKFEEALLLFDPTYQNILHKDRFALQVLAIINDLEIDTINNVEANDVITSSKIESLIKKALQFEKNTHYEAAIDCYTRAIKLDPKDPNLYATRANLRQKMAGVSRAVQIDIATALWLGLKITSLNLSEHYSKIAFEQILSDSKDFKYHLDLAIQYADDKKFMTGCLATMALNQANSLVRLKNYKPATNIFLNAIEHIPTDSLYLSFAIFLATQNKLDEADANYSKIQDINSLDKNELQKWQRVRNDAPAQAVFLGSSDTTSHLFNTMDDKKFQAYKKLIQKAKIAISTNRKATAYQKLDEAIALAPYIGSAYVLKAELLDDENRITLADQYYSTAIRLMPNNLELYAERVALNAKLPNSNEIKTSSDIQKTGLLKIEIDAYFTAYKKRLEYFQSTSSTAFPAHFIDDREAAHLIYLADDALSSHNLDLAIYFYNQLLEKQERNFLALSKRALAYAFKKNITQAYQDVCRSIEICPTSFSYWLRGYLLCNEENSNSQIDLILAVKLALPEDYKNLTNAKEFVFHSLANHLLKIITSLDPDDKRVIIFLEATQLAEGLANNKKIIKKSFDTVKDLVNNVNFYESLAILQDEYGDYEGAYFSYSVMLWLASENRTDIYTSRSLMSLKRGNLQAALFDIKRMMTLSKVDIITDLALSLFTLECYSTAENHLAKSQLSDAANYLLTTHLVKFNLKALKLLVTTFLAFQPDDLKKFAAGKLIMPDCFYVGNKSGQIKHKIIEYLTLILSNHYEKPSEEECIEAIREMTDGKPYFLTPKTKSIFPKKNDVSQPKIHRPAISRKPRGQSFYKETTTNQADEKTSIAFPTSPDLTYQAQKESARIQRSEKNKQKKEAKRLIILKTKQEKIKKLMSDTESLQLEDKEEKQDVVTATSSDPKKTSILSSPNITFFEKPNDILKRYPLKLHALEQALFSRVENFNQEQNKNALILLTGGSPEERLLQLLFQKNVDFIQHEALDLDYVTELTNQEVEKIFADWKPFKVPFKTNLYQIKFYEQKVKFDITCNANLQSLSQNAKTRIYGYFFVGKDGIAQTPVHFAFTDLRNNTLRTNMPLDCVFTGKPQNETEKPEPEAPLRILLYINKKTKRKARLDIDLKNRMLQDRHLLAIDDNKKRDITGNPHLTAGMINAKLKKLFLHKHALNNFNMLEQFDLLPILFPALFNEQDLDMNWIREKMAEFDLSTRPIQLENIFSTFLIAAVSQKLHHTHVKPTNENKERELVFIYAVSLIKQSKLLSDTFPSWTYENTDSVKARFLFNSRRINLRSCLYATLSSWKHDHQLYQTALTPSGVK